MILFYGLLLSCGRSENQRRPLPTDTSANAGNSITKVAGFSAGGGGGLGDGGGDLGGLGGGDNPPIQGDGYLVYEQGDLDEDIMPLVGPVVGTFVSSDEQGNPVHVNVIGYQDPFTKHYQVVEDRSIIVTNHDISQTVAQPIDSYPEAELWTDPDTGETHRIIKGDVMVAFDEATTEQWLWTFFQSSDFLVEMSWFEPREDGQPGNESAVFELSFGESWSGIDEVLEFLLGQPNVELTHPVYLDLIEEHYPAPNDPYYYDPTAYPEKRQLHLDHLPSVNNQNIRFPLENGLWYGFNSYVAVLDSGVDRDQPDFTYSCGSGGKTQSAISLVGVDCYRGKGRQNAWYQVGPLLGDYHADGRRHGTKVAGVIAAATNNALGVASCAPRARIIPVWIQGDEIDPRKFSWSAYIQALIAVNRELGQNTQLWKSQYPRTVNLSLGFVRYLGRFQGAEDLGRIVLDIQEQRGKRLYVASAGNYYMPVKVLPAAYHREVLGVSGLWVREDGQEYLGYVQGFYGGGSTYWTDDPRVYPVSGIFGFFTRNTDTGNPATMPELSYTTSVFTYYEPIMQTSFAVAQVSALASQLFFYHPDWTYAQVMDRIISTRKPDVWNYRGVVDYEAALQD